MLKLQILRNGFDLRLEPFTFDICFEWQLNGRTQAHFPQLLLNLDCNDLKIDSVILFFAVPLAPISIDFDQFTTTSVRLAWNSVVGKH